jgi:beta-lactam-binding protein with PASTA domain
VAGQVPVPDVQGLLLDAAKAQIQDAGLNVGDVIFAQGPDGAQAGTVFDVKPPVGTQLQPGVSIALYVAAPCGQIGNGNGHDKHCGGGGGDGGD